MASGFAVGFDGDLEEAVKAIDTVGQFVEKCGGAAKAKAAIETYRAVAVVVK